MKDNTFSIMNHLTDWMTRPTVGDDKPPSFYPSSAAAIGKDNKLHGSCRRRQFLDYARSAVRFAKRTKKPYSLWEPILKDVESKIIKDSKYSTWIFAQGNLYEEHCLDLIKECGLFQATQSVVYIPEYNVSGKIDNIAFNPETHENVIVEFKSVYGENGNKTLGTEWERNNNLSGEPRDYNLMQIAIYQHYFANQREGFGFGQLVYGDRGDGRYAVYQVDVDKESTEIKYRSIDPNKTPWVTVPYTVQGIMDNYQYLQECLENNIMPEKDFMLSYSDEEMIKRIDESYDIFLADKEEKKTSTMYYDMVHAMEASEGIKGRKFYLDIKKSKNKESVSIAKGVAGDFIKYYDRKINGGREVKRPVAGDYQCGFCKYKNYCYGK